MNMISHFYGCEELYTQYGSHGTPTPTVRQIGYTTMSRNFDLVPYSPANMRHTECTIESHRNVTHLVSRGRVEDVSVDEERPDGLRGRVPVGHLDGLVHVGVVHQVRRAALLHVLVQPVRPTLIATCKMIACCVLD